MFNPTNSPDPVEVTVPQLLELADEFRVPAEVAWATCEAAMRRSAPVALSPEGARSAVFLCGYEH